MTNNYNQLSRYGGIAQALPFFTGKVFFLISSSEAANNFFQQKFPVDEDGRVRVFTAWADVITEVQQSTDSSVIVISPLFTTTPTTAQISALKAAKCVTMQAGNFLPDGSYLATKAAVALATATTTDLFQINGKVRILDIIGEVETTLGAATTGAKFLILPTVGSSTDLCVTTDIKLLAAGGQISITGTLANALVASVNGAIVAQAAPVVAKAGKIQLNLTQTTTGNIRSSVRYIPLEPGAYISAL